MKIIKPKVKVLSKGTVDDCECCNKEFQAGLCCFLVDKDMFIDLCYVCLDDKFEEVE